MIINQDIINGKWLQLQGEIQKVWGRLTADEIEQTKGDIKSIAGIIKQRYGEEQVKIMIKISNIVESLYPQKEFVVADIKRNLKV